MNFILLGKMESEGEIIAGWGKREGDIMESGLHFFKNPVEQKAKSKSRKMRFIEEKGYQAGMRIKDRYTEVEGKIVQITSKGEIIIHDGIKKRKINPLTTKKV